MNGLNEGEVRFEAGDIINVQGTGITSKLIRWATDYDYSHSAMICCCLSNSKYMVIEMVAKGILIRPLSVYYQKKIEVFRVNRPEAKELGERAVLNMVDMIPRCGYGFEKILYLGLILIPRRLFNRRPLWQDLPYDNVRHKILPKGLYQKFCSYVTRIVSTVTLMNHWTSILVLFSRDKWVRLTQNVFMRTASTKTVEGEIRFDEFVRIVEDELARCEQ